MISVIFFGTNKFAAIILDAMINSTVFDIKMVVTQPDRPTGRHQEIQKSPVKILAEKNGLQIFQPESLKNIEFPALNVDLNIVVEYGLIIPQVIIDTPTRGSINIHPSLLPKYRGPSPIQSVLVNGEHETAVTIMLMDKKMDHGPILAQEKVTIADDDDFLSLSEKLSKLSARMIVETAPKYIEGSVNPTAQDDNAASFCKILDKEDGRINFSKTSTEIYNQYRGLLVWPGIYCLWENKRLKLNKICVSDFDLVPGVVRVEGEKIFAGCAGGSIQILELQLEGKKAMAAKEFINGYKEIDGKKLQ